MAPSDAHLPLRIDLKLGFHCNNRCRFCVQGDKRHRLGNLDTEEAKKRLAAAVEHSDSVVFTGGEVTIRDDLVQLVGFARELGFQSIQIQTNGRMLAYPELTRKLVRAGATEFSPALHGESAALHDYLTQSPGSYDQTVRGMKNIRSMGVPIITNSVITRSNFRHLPALARLLIDLGVTQYQFAFVHALGTAGENFSAVVPRMELLSPYVMEGLEAGRRVDVWGTTEAIPACILPGYEEHLAEWILPDARIYDADDILDSYARYRKDEGKVKGPLCADCGLQALCEGPWREYPERYGWSEFKPVSPDRAQEVLSHLKTRRPAC